MTLTITLYNNSNTSFHNNIFEIPLQPDTLLKAINVA